MSVKPLHILSEVISAFFKLGLTAFGGPSAHIAYFREAFVTKRQWLSAEAFSQLLAICQFLPGPASSQLGFAIGLHRAGWLGAIAAFISFTLPSVLLLMLFIACLPSLPTNITSAVLHSLKLVAVVVVADAVLKMATSFCQSLPTKLIAAFSMLITLCIAFPYQQLYLILLAAIAGILFVNKTSGADHTSLHVAYSVKLAYLLLSLFSVLLLISFLTITDNKTSLTAIAQLFYQAGALVFGGGHVVLPLLTASTVNTGLMNEADFLAGYGAAQGLPGPLFSFAAYLGSQLASPNHVDLGAALVATLAIFLPGFLLLAGVLPFWQRLMQYHLMQTAVIGVNAAVVGLLAATWLQPLLLSTVTSIQDAAIALLGFVCLYYWRKPVMLVISLIVVLYLLSNIRSL